MSLKIILNTELKSTELKNEQFQLEGSFVSTTEEMVKCTYSDNQLINAFLLAYNHHRTLSLCPDDLLLSINQVVSNCINTFPETFRSTFVDHSGTKKLTTVLDRPQGYRDWNDIIEQIHAMLKKSLKVDYPLFPEFSTTTSEMLTASHLTTMSAFKKYFCFEGIFACGIPAVELRGTVDDWCKLLHKYSQLKELFRSHNYEHLEHYFVNMDVILDLFMSMRNLADTGEVEGTQEMKDLWSRVVTYVPYGSGHQQYLSGWSQCLFPDFNKNQPVQSNNMKLANLLDLESKMPNENNYTCRSISIAIGQPQKEEVYLDCYKWQDAMKEWAQFCRTSISLGNSVCECHIELHDYGKTSKVTFQSGFVGVQERDDEVINPVVGWWATEEPIEEGK